MIVVPCVCRCCLLIVDFCSCAIFVACAFVFLLVCDLRRVSSQGTISVASVTEGLVGNWNEYQLDGGPCRVLFVVCQSLPCGARACVVLIGSNV
jgi:hypothetical protein